MTVAPGLGGLLLAVALCALVHVAVMAFAGRALGVALEELTFGLGPRLLRVGKLSIRLLPVGGAVRFKTADDMPPEGEADVDSQRLEAQPLGAQLFIGASGCIALIALACALLGGMAGAQALVAGFANIAGGALSQMHTAQALLARVDAAAHGLPFLTLLGLTAATTAALNLLPLPGANGGYLLGALGRGAGLHVRWPAAFTQILLFAYIALAASWLFAAAMFLAR